MKKDYTITFTSAAAAAAIYIIKNCGLLLLPPSQPFSLCYILLYFPCSSIASSTLVVDTLFLFSLVMTAILPPSLTPTLYYYYYY